MGGNRHLCLNCGTALLGDHCHACGQAAHVHRSLGAIGHELAHGVFHFEGKVFRTLPLLVLRPGELTRRYIAVERARFVSPLALFLFTVFLMFATISAVGGGIEVPGVSESRAAVARIDADLTRARRDLKVAEAKGRRDIAELRTTISALETARATAGGEGFVASNITTGWKKLDKGIAKANANPGLLFYKMQSSAYKYSWALIPLSVPFVALLFAWRRRYHLYDHAVFVTYSLSFMMLLVITVTIGSVGGIPESLLDTLIVLAPPAHMFAQLRGAYRLRKRSAAWRTVALMTFSLIALVAFGALLLVQGLTA